MADPVYRTVNDILTAKSGVVAFVALNSLIAGRPAIYQGVCPLCARDLASPVGARIYGELYDKLVNFQVAHRPICTNAEATLLSVRLPDGTTGFLDESGAGNLGLHKDSTR